MFIVEAIGQFVSEILRRHGVLGISAIGIVAGVARAGAQILAASPAEFAGAVHVTEPCDSDSLSNMKSRDIRSDPIDPPNDLMPGNHRSAVQRQVAFDDMKIRPADRTNAHLYSHFVRRRLRFFDLAQNEGRFAHRLRLR